MKRTKTWAKWLTASVLALAIAVPAGAASAATVQYKVYYYTNQGSGYDWNSWIQQYLKYYYGYNGSKTVTRQPANNTVTKPTTPQQPASNTGTTASTSSYASQVVTLVNKERAKAGLKPLTVNANLANVALVKAQDMKNNNYFSHNSPTYGSPFDMMKSFGISYRYAGENIAMGQRTPQEVMNAWMNSSGHRANILSANFTQIGVAYYNGYWVQEFIG